LLGGHGLRSGSHKVCAALSALSNTNFSMQADVKGVSSN